MTKHTKVWIEHLVDIEFYGNALFQELKDLYDNFYEVLITILKAHPHIKNKREFKKLLNRVRDDLEVLDSRVMNLLDKELETVVSTEEQWLKAFCKKIGIPLITTGVLSKVKFMPIGSISDKETLVKNVSTKIQNFLERSLRINYIAVKPTQDTIDKIEIKRDRIEKEVKQMASDFETSSFRNTDKIIFMQNDVELIYSSILDGNTCIECGSYNGKVFSPTEAPVLPIHHNCRCSLLPYNDKTKNIPTFSEWLKSETEDVQKDVLGKTRYELFKRGMPVEKFTNSGKIILLKDLIKKT
jgi:hypothetical protein